MPEASAKNTLSALLPVCASCTSPAESMSVPMVNGPNTYAPLFSLGVISAGWSMVMLVPMEALR